MTYQWKKNGVNVTTGEGATASTYSIPVTATEDSGEYSVVVSNGLGSATSNAATLTVSRYSLVAKTGGGTYELTECVKDLKTGLIWEGKNPPGSDTRAADTKYTNFDSWTVAQKWNGSMYVVVPQADVELVTNSYGYAKAVKESALCGFTSWRMPTTNELKSIREGNQTSPRIDTAWFPNTQYESDYWTSTPTGINPNYPDSVSFKKNEDINYGTRRDSDHVRLVLCPQGVTCTLPTP